MKTAVLVDGEFFLRRHRTCYGAGAPPRKVADDLFTIAIKHCCSDGGEKRDLHRILFYDCPPLEKKAHRPISKKAIDFSKSDVFRFRTELHRNLHQKRKLAIRSGRLHTRQATWRLKDEVLRELLTQRRTFDTVSDDDFIYDVKQKGVDMKIGLDIASLSQRRLVERIVLIAGDADFVPAAKLARREGVDFILDPMWRAIPDDLLQHIDGLRSPCPRPVHASRPANEHREEEPVG